MFEREFFENSLSCSRKKEINAFIILRFIGFTKKSMN